MNQEHLTDSETVVLRMQFRTMILFQYLRWDSYYRRIGQVLLSSSPGAGVTIHGISRLTRIPRKTVRRKLASMVDNRLVQKDEAGQYSHTEFGRSMHIRTWRDIMEVARGQRTGLSPGVIEDLRKMPTFNGYDYEFLQNVRFDDTANLNVEPAGKVRRSPVPSCI